MFLPRNRLVSALTTKKLALSIVSNLTINSKIDIVSFITMKIVKNKIVFSCTIILDVILYYFIQLNNESTTFD